MIDKGRKIDFGARRDWVAKPKDDWLEWAGNPNFPDYLRVTFVAHGRMKANGHASLNQGELARYLVRKTGALPDRRSVYRAVDKAVQLGYLTPESRVLCLVLDPSRSQFGIGDPDEKCRRAHSRGLMNTGTEQRDAGRFTQKDGTERGRFAGNDGTDCRPSERKDGTDHRPFTLSPSLSSTPTPTTNDRKAG